MSRIINELIETVSNMNDLGVIDDITMRNFNAAYAEKPKSYSAAKIKKLRTQYNISQPVFAILLGTSVSTLKKWEQGERQPSAIACKLLSIVEHNGIEILAN